MSDLDAEIEQLRNEIVVLQRNQLYMEELCTRAADVLEEYLPLVHQTWNAKVSARSKLIAELRKAAE